MLLGPIMQIVEGLKYYQESRYKYQAIKGNKKKDPAEEEDLMFISELDLRKILS